MRRVYAQGFMRSQQLQGVGETCSELVGLARSMAENFYMVVLYLMHIAI